MTGARRLRSAGRHEACGTGSRRRELLTLAGDPKLCGYPFYWAARADLERRGGQPAAARAHYEHAIALSRSPAEQISYQRRLDLLKISP